MKDKEEKSIKNKFKFNLKIIKLLLCIIILFIGVFYIYTGIIRRNVERRITVRTQLDKIENISELSTAVYTYNSVATKYTDENEDNIEYHVICYGEVTTGIDFDKIQIEIKGKVVKLTLPELEIQSINIPIDKLQFIEEKKYKEKDNLLQDAHDLCESRIKEKVNSDGDFKDAARENTKLTIEGFLKPWLDTIDSSYKIEFK